MTNPQLPQYSIDDVRQLLDEETCRINTPAFIGLDPVQFPRRYTSLPDIEITSLLASTIAWGNRRMICRNIERLLDTMNGEPHRYLISGAYEDLDPKANIHRTFFNANLQHYLRGLRLIYQEYGTLQQYARKLNIANHEAPAWELARGINCAIAEANEGMCDSRCLPSNLDTTALKRLNMALRWLVRRDGIVDLGVWDVIEPSQLYIPLDVHVGNTARELGILQRRGNDRKAVEQLTALLRQWCPDDPVKYDFALFGIGVGVTNNN